MSWEDLDADEHAARLPELVTETYKDELVLYHDGGWSAPAHEASQLLEEVKEDQPCIVVNWTHLSSGDVTVNEEGEVEGSILLDDMEEDIRNDWEKRVEQMLNDRVAFLSTTSLWETDLEKCEGR
jgi:hypothetical protein